MDKDYSDAMATIIKYDHDQLETVVDAIGGLETTYDSCVAKLRAIADDYASINATSVGAGADINSYVSQLSMVEYSLTNVSQMAAQALAARNPAPIPAPASDSTTAS